MTIRDVQNVIPGTDRLMQLALLPLHTCANPGELTVKY
jgi:hypothetical protein